MEQKETRIPWEIYPRPLCKRSSFFNLNGEWELAYHDGWDAPSEYPLRITLPFPPEARASGAERAPRPSEFIFYRRRFTLPEGFALHRTLLHFGAVDQEAEVYLNGVCLGSHTGGYLPFCFDVTAHLAKENVLVVRVLDTLSHDYPYGKQRRRRGGMWYTPISGIWQTVWMESFPEGGIYGISVRGNDTSVTVRVDTDARAVLHYNDGQERHIPFCGEVTLTPQNRRLWSPEEPNLYPFTVTTETDSAASYFALRSLTVRTVGGAPRLCLNGKPYFFHGLLDQGYFEDGIYLPSDPSEYERDVLRAKALGFNMLRKHIKVEPAVFYEACDRLGMVVFQDAVNNGAYSFLLHTALPTLGMKRFPAVLMRKSKRAKEIFKKHTEEMLGLLCSYPSVLYFTIFNEAWGQADADALYTEYKQGYPDVILDTASGWFKTQMSDVRSDHVYFKPVKADYEGEEKPIVLSEFGGYSLRIAGHLYNLKRNYGYRTLHSEEELTDALRALYTDEILPAIQRGLSASVYTQLSDVEDETNGLYTYDRAVQKVDTVAMREIADGILRTLKECTQNEI